jgi:esterase/lipase superfamily enzyme
MHTEYHRWFSHRLGRDMGVVVYGHWGAPMLVFPTSGGDEWETRNQGMLGALADFVEAGRIKLFCVALNSTESFYNQGAHPYHRSWMQCRYAEYVREEVVPFIHASCRTTGIPITTMGPSLGAYHAVNMLLKHPDVFKRCFGLSGLYDMKRFMDGMYDDHFYFNNPVDYMANLADPWFYREYESCDIRLVTGTGPWERSEATYQLAEVLRSKGIRHFVDDWGPLGGHDWPYWHHIMREYVGQMY